MRGSNRKNEAETRQLCKNICNFTGLSSLMTKHFLIIVQEALIHRVTELALQTKQDGLGEAEIEIPFIGCLVVNFIDGNIVSTIELEDEFKQQLWDARDCGKSPLLDHLKESVVRNILEKYEALL